MSTIWMFAVCPNDVAYLGVGVLLLVVTFDLCHAPPTLTLAYPNPSPSVNEHEDPGAIVRLAGR